jgi:D-alanine transaminase
MPRLAYVNGRFLPHAAAAVHIEDRGFQFADGVYEVVAVGGGRLMDEAGHLDRLNRSLGELRIAWPVSRRVLGFLMRRLIARNRLTDGIVYLQITRGVAPRDFRFPPQAEPSLVMTTRRIDLHPRKAVEEGWAVATMPDIRWKRRDIKSVALLPQVLGKQRAAEAGAMEGWMVDEEGFVTEGCSSNAWIVTPEGTLVTRRADHMILNGVTRLSILELARRLNVPVEERPFTVAEAKAAREAFLSSASTFVTPVTSIDGQPVGNGHPGSTALALRQAYIDYAAAEGAS